MVIVILSLVNVFANQHSWEKRIAPNVLLVIMHILNANLVIALQMEHSWSMGYLTVGKVQRHNVHV